jgi:hypothetical protein
MRTSMILALSLLAAGCTPHKDRPGGLIRSDTPARSEAPAANTGLLRPEAGVDPGIRAPLPGRSPTTTPVIPPSPSIQAR